MATILQPVITSQLSRQAAMPGFLRYIPFFGNSRTPSEALGFANPYRETTQNNNQYHRQQQAILHNETVNIVDRVNRNTGPRINLAPMPSESPQISAIRQQREMLLKQNKQQELAKVAFNKGKHETMAKLDENIDKVVELSLQDRINDIRKQLARNQQEESKGDNDTVYRDTLVERRQLIKDLADLSKQRNKERQDAMSLTGDSRGSEPLMVPVNQAGSISHVAHDQVPVPVQQNFTEDQLNEIQQFNNLLRKSNISSQQQEEILQDIQLHGLQPFNSYDKYDARNYLRNPSKPVRSNNEPNGQPNGGNGGPGGNNDPNDLPMAGLPNGQPNDYSQIQQAALNRLGDIINNPQHSDQEKADAIHQHIQNLDHHEINIIYNIYSGDIKEDAKNNVHGHVDADAILTSLIE